MNFPTSGLTASQRARAPNPLQGRRVQGRGCEQGGSLPFTEDVPTCHSWHISWVAVLVRELWLKPTDTGSSELKHKKKKKKKKRSSWKDMGYLKKGRGSLRKGKNWGAWVAVSGKRPTLDFGSGHDLTVFEPEPRGGLLTDSAEPAWIVSLPPCPSPAHACSLEISK